MMTPRPGPQIRTTVRRMQVTVLAVLGACSGESRGPTQPPENCFGSFLLIEPRGAVLPVGDSLILVARPTVPFLVCFPGRPFQVSWDADPDTGVVVRANSDSTAWVRGVAPGLVRITAQLPGGDSLFDRTTMTVQ